MLSLARSVVVGACLGGALWIGAVRPAAGQLASPAADANEAAIEQALAQETDWSYTDTPLFDVVEDIAAKFHIPIQLDKKALADSGIAEDTPITRHLRRVSLRSALELMLGDFDLTYVIRDEVLLITTKSEVENMLVTKVYQVADLVTPDPDFIPDSKSMLFDVVSFSRSWKGYAPLISLITACLAPTTWEDVGGPGTIKALVQAKALVISQTTEVHEEVAELLAALRAVRDVQRAAGKAMPPAPAEPPDDKLYLRVYRVYDYLRGTEHPSIESFMCVADDEPAAKSSSTSAAPAPQPEREPTSTPATLPASQPQPLPGAQPPRNSREAPDNQSQPNQPSAAELGRQAKEIVAGLPRLVEPSSWADAGGQGTLRMVAGSLFVRQTRQVHDEIVAFLQIIVPGRAGRGMGGSRAAGPTYPPSPLAPRGSAPDWPTQAEPRPGRSLAAIERALSAKTDWVFSDAPLADVVESLKNEYGIEICLDSRALADAGVAEDTPITRRLEGVSLRSALRLMLGEFDLTYVLRSEVLVITTKSEAENLLVLKVYPVLDLCRQGYGEVISVISESIEATTWGDVGGPGVIKPFGNCGALVVSQTTEVHDEIARLLAELRIARDNQAR